MFLNTLFRSHRMHTYFNLFGLSLSLAAVLLLTAHNIQEWQMNRKYPHADRLYLLVNKNHSTRIPESMLEAFRKEVPGIENATMWSWSGGDGTFGLALGVDTSFLQMFGITLQTGSMEAFTKGEIRLMTPRNIDFISNMEASNPPQVSALESHPYGIISNPDRSNGFLYDMLLPSTERTSGTAVGSKSESKAGTWLEYTFSCAVLLRSNVHPDSIEVRINALLKEYPGNAKNSIQLMPFKKVYADRLLTDDNMKHANTNMTQLLSLVALVILLLALLNYLNLTTTRNASRWVEVGIRKTVGADTRSIFVQFLLETYGLFVLATMLAFVLAILAKPFVESLIGSTIYIDVLYGDLGSILAFLGVFLFIGLFSGILSAWSASQMTPMRLMGKREGQLNGFFIRKLLSVVQFTACMVLIFSLLTVLSQLHYVKTKPLGFNDKNLMKIDLAGVSFEKAAALKDALRKDLRIKQVSLSFGEPGRDGAVISYSEHQPGGLDYYSSISVDTNFLQTFEMQLIKGRNITGRTSDGLLINETAYKALGSVPLDSITSLGSPVCGVIRDFHTKDMHNAYSPIVIGPLVDGFPINSFAVSLRLPSVEIQQTRASVEAFVSTFMKGYSYTISYYDRNFDDLYKQEEKQALSISVFSLIALLISCLGLFGLAYYYTQNKTKEIGIRRVNGAKIGTVLWQQNWFFIKPLALSFILSCPIGWLLMHRWLETFAFRITISWWLFALTGLIAFVVALLTVSGLSWRAATRNPVESLRYE